MGFLPSLPGQRLEDHTTSAESLGSLSLGLAAKGAGGVVDDGVVQQAGRAVTVFVDRAAQPIRRAIDALKGSLDQLAMGRFFGALAIEVGAEGDDEQIVLDAQGLGAT